ncbi:hypothetical protein D3C78_1743000 [compost metagenome]
MVGEQEHAYLGQCAAQFDAQVNAVAAVPEIDVQKEDVRIQRRHLGQSLIRIAEIRHDLHARQ